MSTLNPSIPEPSTKEIPQGLYHSRFEHDACGTGFVAHLRNRKSHAIVAQALEILARLTHRGAVGADPLAGDGAGVMLQIPDRLLREETAKLGIQLPEAGTYAVGMVFLPRDETVRKTCETLLEERLVAEGQRPLGWRDVPVDSALVGESVRASEPVIRQIFVARGEACADPNTFKRKVFVARKQTHTQIRAHLGAAAEGFYVVTLSAETITYKGMILAERLADFYHDLADPRLESALALVHARFSTNTMPSWGLAQPFRYLCHNGEINTVRGNINWMMARRHNLRSDVLGEDLEKLWPLIGDGNSDSATFDNCLELLLAAGYSLPHAMLMMVPEAWDGNALMESGRRAFYEYHAAMMEPWDGPAALTFTDGRQIGATLDRNGLRPARYLVTDDDLVVMASEAGVLDIPDEKIVRKWRLQPGRMLLIDVEAGAILDDDAVKADLANARPYAAWLAETQIHLEDLPYEVAAMPPHEDALRDRQQAFGYTHEDLKIFLKPMAQSAQDTIGSMGRGTPLAVLSQRPKILFDYFQQRFAQVTNPPIDPIREELVMSMVSLIGPRPNLLDPGAAPAGKRLEVLHPILSNVDLERIRRIEDHTGGAFRTRTLSMCYPRAGETAGMGPALERLCAEAEEAVRAGYNIVVLSDRALDVDHVPIPSLLGTSAVHHHLIRKGLRTETGLVVETGEARQVHDMCLLGGYGAEAINPYLAFDTVATVAHRLVDINATGDSPPPLSPEVAIMRYTKALTKGMAKVMSKMGISTWQSYCGAQIFDCVGLASQFIDAYFPGTYSAVEGIGLDQVATDAIRRHDSAFGDSPIYRDQLDVGGEILMRLRGEHHVWTFDTVSLLQHAVRGGDGGKYRRYADLVGKQDAALISLRGLLDFIPGEPVPLDEVEPLENILPRFATGAMSFGSISWEAHTTLAIAMNRIGGKSNTGEGGEDPVRYKPLENGDSMRSAIKQVASGRFGVTAEYLVNADDIQIKMAQGAKPGEGGQLPGHKVDDWIARVRHSVPGVGLISPPPHHDIYSIEDLAQLIHDLKNVNEAARISVKLVAEPGVGTVAAGVVKAHADHITISGHDGGTGASPLTSIHHAGGPWEIGLAEAHQTLVRNGLRGRVALQVDGGLRNGRDVAIAALLGAEEFGFATAPLIAEGCVMMRKCHLNTCPTGVATQNPELRKLFPGKPEHIVNFFHFVAEELREIMAGLGFRRMEDMVGRSDRLRQRDLPEGHKARGIDLSPVLYRSPGVDQSQATQCVPQDHGLANALDHQLIAGAAPALERKEPVRLRHTVRNTHRSLGAMLSGAVARRYGHAGLPDDTIHIDLEGSAGQSLGAFLARGITLNLEGEANDYVGKGLSGGHIIIRPPQASLRVASENILIGNTVLYGAIAGSCYFSGVAGERFAVRNSGALAVVEGTGDHGCEYMTGGIVAVLGTTGRNFAAGMSGGIAYVLDEAGDFEHLCNREMVDLERVGSAPGEADTLFRAYGLIDETTQGPETETEALRTLVARHLQMTGSARARDLLERWTAVLPRFVKVMPREFRRALLQTAAREALVPVSLAT